MTFSSSASCWSSASKAVSTLASSSLLSSESSSPTPYLAANAAESKSSPLSAPALSGDDSPRNRSTSSACCLASRRLARSAFFVADWGLSRLKPMSIVCVPPGERFAEVEALSGMVCGGSFLLLVGGE